MALSLTTAIKNQVAMRVFSGRTYAALGAGYEQDLIDTEGAAALIELENYANWFALVAGTGAAPDAWAPWFADRIICRLEPNAHPERMEAVNKVEMRSRADALATYARLSPAYDPASTTEAFVYQMVNVRKYTIAHCARMRPPLFPDPMTIDAAFAETAAFVFSRAGWTFRRRPVTMIVTRTAFRGGTWTESTKTISGLTSVGTGLAAGTRFYVTGGTSATYPGEHSIASTTSTTVVLNSSIGSGANGSTDIAGFYVTVSFEGLEASETFDAIASTKWFYLDSGYEGEAITWLSSDDFARVRALDSTTTGRPCFMRTFQVGSSTTAWLFSPPPDASYRVRGEVYIAQSADPSSGTSTNSFSKFSLEFEPTIRRMVLDRVLTNYGRRDEALHRDVMDEVESVLPLYQSAGEPPGRVGTPDVYGDRAAQDGWTCGWGGQGI